MVEPPENRPVEQIAEKLDELERLLDQVRHLAVDLQHKGEPRERP